MALKVGKSELSKVVEALEAEHETVGDAAVAVLDLLEVIFQARCKFVVVGQLSSTPDRLEIPPTDPEAIKVSLGFYSTEGDARSAAESLWSSAASGETYRTWVLPTFHGTPADLHAKRKEKYAADAEKAKEKAVERMALLEVKRQAEAQARAVWFRELCLCGHERIDHRLTAAYANHPKKDTCAGCHCTGFIDSKENAA